MPRSIFVNLPVSDLARSTTFYEALGGTRNPQFSNEGGACIVFSDTVYAMLLTHARYGEFTTRPIADARATSAGLYALSCDSIAEVDAVVASGASGGGRADPNTKQDHGFMYGRSVEDPDGHVWEIFWMDPKVAAGGQG
ncbi:lactoylglutathione lyase [Phreatobacter aquaticus]|uniref:Lactoylglutathione lyase n=1 Tax=Phreatobacter aquaticus TaxID=2570229 RepID=A0A4D7QD77_9HYPH|nr:VOC family protein [Phreatobacter aquaticus]QCK85960.1 lactoylglutathione lyase [Phreatobacter aquaticus]